MNGSAAFFNINVVAILRWIHNAGFGSRGGSLYCCIQVLNLRLLSA
jgi:hypothetical protein